MFAVTTMRGVMALVVGLSICGAGNACNEGTTRQATFDSPRGIHRLLVMGQVDDPQLQDMYASLEARLEPHKDDLNITLELVDADNPDTEGFPSDGPIPPPPGMTFPVTALMGRDAVAGQTFVIDLWDEPMTDEDWDVMVASPAREALKESVLTTWGTILHLPGNNPEETARVQGIIDGAVAKWSEEKPPGIGVVTLDRNDPVERTVVSFIGEVPPEEEWVGIVFGRGKLMAPPLMGEAIIESSVNQLIENLTLPCTCTNDPDKLGVDLPMILTPEWEARIVSLDVPEDDAEALPSPVAEMEERADALIAEEMGKNYSVLFIGLAVVGIIVLVAMVSIMRKASRREE